MKIFIGALVLVLFVMGVHDNCFAYMTLFNDKGDWQLGILDSLDEENKTYRVCRNSSDRHKGEDSDGSLAFLCLVANPHRDEHSLDIWHSEALGEPGEVVPCVITLDDSNSIYEQCRIMPTKIGKAHIVLTRDKKLLSQILTQKNFTVLIGNNQANQLLQPLEFDIDLAALKKAVEPVPEHFGIIPGR